MKFYTVVGYFRADLYRAYAECYAADTLRTVLAACERDHPTLTVVGIIQGDHVVFTPLQIMASAANGHDS